MKRFLKVLLVLLLIAVMANTVLAGDAIKIGKSDQRPAVAGSNVAWIDHAGINVQNISTQKTTSIYTETDPSCVAIGGTDTVWIAWYESSRGRLGVHRLGNADDTYYIPAAGISNAPVISGDRMVYGTDDNCVHESNLTTRTEIWSSLGKNPSIDGGRIAYENNGSIVIYDDTGAITFLTGSEGYLLKPKIWGNQVIFYATDTDNLIMRDLNTGVQTSITSHPFDYAFCGKVVYSLAGSGVFAFDPISETSSLLNDTQKTTISPTGAWVAVSEKDVASWKYIPDVSYPYDWAGLYYSTIIPATSPNSYIVSVS